MSVSQTTDLVDIKSLNKHCRHYREAQTGKAVFQLVSTFGAFLILTAAIGWAVMQGIYWPLIGVVLNGGLLIRLFIIQHDCGHRSFFKSSKANDWTGRALSLFTFTPYGFWRSTHNMHHAGSGNLDHRGIGSIDTLTVEEYKALSPRKKLEYRIYRNPIVLLVIGTPLYMIFIQRIPHGKSSPFFANYDALSFARSWKSIFGHDLALLAFYAGFVYLFGWAVLLLVLLPSVIIASWIGGWLFYIQHQFEDGYWEMKGEWSFHEAAVMGSSYLVLPKVLQWFSGNIGLHHIHHLCATIPNYRLQECLDGSETLQNLNRLTLKETLPCLKWRLWCEKSKKMVGFDAPALKPA
jgi:omega-6 fatty acid desaturase (delta-12 desaturase)